MAQQQNRKLHLTLLSVLSALAVVMLHTNGCFWTFSTERYWFSANIIESVMYFAVPVFFMISGTTLLDYSDKYSTKVYFKKRFQKTLIPFVVWSCVGIVYRLLVKSLTVNDIWPLSLLITKIFNTNIISIYWFFISLFSVYLVIPILSAISKEKRMETYTYLIIVCFIFNYFLPFVCKFINVQYNSNMFISAGSNYVIYLCTGYILDRYILDKKKTMAIYLIALISVLMMIIGTYNLSMASGTIVQTFKGYQSLPCYLYSAGIFLLIKNISKFIKNEKVICFIEWLGSYTFALYLTHWFIMNIMIKVFSINTVSIVYRVIAPFAIYAINIVITYIVRKLPLGQYVLP